ncbi:hypothetical protein AYO44_11010 [Planctomycetaceae bacterium SCGC AG-212-F19]|nr:hypothetical protein AYO44_11010 [Planctomycetaceae bacterium SCGC AG-212-F19]
MASAPFGTVLRHIFQRMGTSPGADPTDDGLLARFTTDRDEAAFAELVRRHGPMVLGVCKRILRDPNDADDAFQATFLVLARKATPLDGRRPLACWLFTVARNLALNHRLAAARRRAREKEARAMRSTEPGEQTAWDDMGEVLDAELGRLPEKYRAPLILCHLQGLTHEAAARELGWPAGSLAKRLTRGLELLRERLVGRGLALPAAGLAALIGEHASAAVSPSLVIQISRAASLYALGQATQGLVSTSASALAEGALPALFFPRWKVAAAVLFAISVLGAGAAVLGHRSELPPVATPAVPQDKRAAPPATADPRDQDVRRRLARVVVLERGIDPNTPLKDALEYLTKRFDLEFRVDEKAFAAAGVEAVDERTVSLPRLAVPLGTILRLLLRQIDPDNGQVSGYRIEQGVVVLAPAFYDTAEERFPRGLPQRLFQPVRCDREPYDQTLADALTAYGKLYGQKLVLDHKAFAEVGEPDPDRYPLAGRGRELAEEPCLLEILNLILWQVDGPTWKSYLRVQDGALEITAAKHDSAQAKMLAAHREMIDEYWGMWTGTPRGDVTLRQKVLLDKGIDPNTPLIDVLEFLSDRWDLTIVVDELAFAGAGIENVREFPVQLEPQRTTIPLEKALRRILDQVKTDTYTAGFVCREGYFEIIPEHNQLRQKKPLEARHLDQLWQDLAARSEGRSRLAVQTLAQAPREALPYLKVRLKPGGPPERDRGARARKLVAELDSDQFAVRERATEELEKWEYDAIPVLRERLAEKPSLEVVRRIERILQKLGAQSPNPELARTLRSVRVLEAIGTREAQQVLETLASGEPEGLPTRAARAALERIRP